MLPGMWSMHILDDVLAFVLSFDQVLMKVYLLHELCYFYIVE